jgi:phospholipase C
MAAIPCTRQGSASRLARAVRMRLLLLAVLLAAPAAAPAASPRLPAFKHVVVIVMENKEEGQLTYGGAAPNFMRFAARGATLAAYHAVTHPSLPNYLALVSGSTQGVRVDCTVCRFAEPNLADALAAAGKTWKTYAEDLPRAGWDGPRKGLYVKKHNPFLYFDSVTDRPLRMARIVPLTRLAQDLAAKRLPDFSLVVPNLCHDMHDCSVRTGDAWLGSFLPGLLASPALEGGVVFVVFDEGSTHVRGGGHIPAIALGKHVRPHSRYTTVMTHYSLLRTIEDAWKLDLLGRSARAHAITGIWR